MFETCALLHLNEDDSSSQEEHDIFSTEDSDAPFFNFLYVCLGIIGGILIVGTIFEIVRRSGWVKGLKVEDQVA